ncbi:hypothetical protein ROS62_11070 [Streptomyces sp. DSM 41972]|uniref:Uncharacterized protein n=1 Tax=Streptomyces althioticus subsp. attaecolombicae TaxID=3075534 RepID=A0ABU3HXH4_9ACTN|nr:hypothetical protein [Streptomyces sp. DSM 41972]SCD65017.1 hypothetical protein GA0115238_119250 [Streptomyces sp. di50b]SCD69646.1 hypothetical protein GA0115245_111734 [Streptomyces sp. di188]
MSMAMCPLCSDDEDIEVRATLDGGRRVVRHRCGFEWEHGGLPSPQKQTHRSFEALKARFPKPEDVDPERLERVARLKAQYLAVKPDLDSRVAAYWSQYQEIFAPDGLRTCNPQVLKDFANSEIGARPGNQATFNSAWNDMGDVAAAEATRSTIGYLLHGPGEVPLEDRLQQLLDGSKPFAMTGFKEALLTRVLCVVYPERFLTILKYMTDAGGKREIARLVYGLELPAPESVSWTRGRLILWSNDLLRTLVGEGFANQQHSAAFLWWAKDRIERSG